MEVPRYLAPGAAAPSLLGGSLCRSTKYVVVAATCQCTYRYYIPGGLDAEAGLPLDALGTEAKSRLPTFTATHQLSFKPPSNMSDTEDHLNPEPPSIDPYEVLGLERDATPDQVKSAYRKAALKHHPGRFFTGNFHLACSKVAQRYLTLYLFPKNQDKVPESQKEEAHIAFQRIALANAVLSDPTRRKRYDTTGSTSESIIDADGFDWTEYYRAAYADAISHDAIEKFAKVYKGSDEEKDDLLAAYEQHKGNMTLVYESVMLSNVLEDDERFRQIIDEAIQEGDVEAFKAYARESAASKSKRKAAARSEAVEAEEYAKEIGVHDKLFGGKQEGKSKESGKGKAKGKKTKESSQDALAALIQSRQKGRMDSLNRLAEKYGANIGEDEPDEAAFQVAAAKLGSQKQKKKKASEDPAPRAGKKARR